METVFPAFADFIETHGIGPPPLVIGVMQFMKMRDQSEFRMKDLLCFRHFQTDSRMHHINIDFAVMRLELLRVAAVAAVVNDEFFTVQIEFDLISLDKQRQPGIVIGPAGMDFHGTEFQRFVFGVIAGRGMEIGDQRTLDSIPEIIQEIDRMMVGVVMGHEQEIELAAGDGIRQLVFFNDRRPGLYLTKVDSANLSKPIPNARFKIEAVDGSWGPQELLTGADGTIDLSALPHLNATAYVVTELDCPGYVIDDAQRIVWLKPNEDMEFVFTNSILPSLHLLKTDSLGNLVAGTSYRLAKIEDGSRYLDRTTSSTGEILWEGLEPGVYSLVETATRSNLILDPREYHVQLFPGKTSEIVLENHIRPNLIVYKYDADTGEPIADTVFKISAADGHSVDEIRTDRNGRATLANLLPGVYEVTEKSVPNDWLLDAPSEQVTLYANRDHAAYFYNHKKPNITVRKVSSVTGDPLQGAKFHVEYASNNTDTGERNDLGFFYTGEDGAFTLTHQRDGWYKITEVTPPTGYAISEAAQEF